MHDWLVIAFSLYGLASVASVAALFADREWLDLVSAWSMRAGFLGYSAFLAQRWSVWRAHPPWYSIYETLVFFAWSVVAVSLGLDFKQKARGTPVLIAGLAMLLSLAAWMSPDKGIEPLAPTLQSALLYLHPPLGILAYGAFAASAAFGFFVLLRDRVKTDTLLFAVSVVAVGMIPFAGGKDFYGSVLGMTLGWAAFCGFAAHVFLSCIWLLLPIPTGKLGPSAILAHAGERIGILQALMRICFLVSWIGLVIAAFALIPALEQPHAILYGACAIEALAAVSTFLVLLLRFRPRVEARLPALPALDRWAYQSMIAAFVFLGICLFLGMLWAFLVSGRYWSWDAKEMWTLSLWIFAGIYLIARHKEVPAPARSMAVLSCIGFFVSLFTYLGVDLLLTSSTYHLFAGAG